jgi:hypothetical protein
VFSHGCLLHPLLVHKIGDFHCQDALERRSLDSFEDSFLAKKIIERAPIVGVLVRFRLGRDGRPFCWPLSVVQIVGFFLFFDFSVGIFSFQG